MAEPVSIIAGVLGILRVALSLIAVVKSNAATSDELRTLETELDHLGDVLQDVRKITGNHQHSPQILVKNMETAQDKVQQVHDFIHGRMYSGEPARRKIRRLSLIRDARKLKRFAQDVHSTRSRLSDCLTILDLSYAVHSPTQESKSEPLHIPFIHSGFESGHTNQDGIRDTPGLSYTETELHELERLESPSSVRAFSDTSTLVASPTSPLEAFPSQRRTQKQAVDVVNSLVERTHHAMVSEDVSLHKHLAEIYRELGQNRLQVQRLTQAVGAFAKDRQQQSSFASYTEIKVTKTDVPDDSSSDSSSSYAGSDASDIFFDCISRFSEDFSDASVKRLQAKFSGNPDYFLEANPTFYPEQYIMSDTFKGIASIVSMTELGSTSTYRLRKYFLMYAESPRSWLRVTVLARIFICRQQSAFSAFETLDVLGMGYRTLPFQNQLETLLKSEPLLDTVTNLSIRVAEEESGEIVIDSDTVSVAEDTEQIQMSNETAMMRDIDDMGCPQFLQSEVIVLLRFSTYTYIVQVESQLCLEEKLPFATGSEGGHETEDFYNDFKTLYSLPECKYVSKFVGVVLDDTRKHLRSYLTELPFKSHMASVLVKAEADGELIPWPVRELWAKQIITAVSHLHARGISLGGLFCLRSLSIRPDGDVNLFAVKPSGRQYLDTGGLLPLELRDQPNPTISSFRTDLFQLGLTLWLLAEHKAYYGGLYCRTNACTQWPRYLCKAEHTNPIELPRCSRDDVPEFFNTIIAHCRQSDPKARMPARLLLQYFDRDKPAPDHAWTVTKYPSTIWDMFMALFCDECGAHIPSQPGSSYYNCAVCLSGDFDICQSCKLAGVHCYVAEHKMEKFSADRVRTPQQG